MLRWGVPRTLVLLLSQRDARDDFRAEPLEVIVVLMEEDVLATAKAHYLETSSAHCDGRRQFRQEMAMTQRLVPDISSGMQRSGM